MEAQRTSVAFEERCPDCGKPQVHGGAEVRRDPVRGMARIVLVPSLIALVVASAAFLWIGDSVTPGSEAVSTMPSVRFALGLAILVFALAGLVSGAIALAQQPAVRCGRCGSVAFE